MSAGLSGMAGLGRASWPYWARLGWLGKLVLLGWAALVSDFMILGFRFLGLGFGAVQP